MVLTTGPIENEGNQPANATNARVKILNRNTFTLTGVVRSIRLNGTRILIDSRNFSVPPSSSTFIPLSLVHPTLGRAAQYEVDINPNQPGGLYSVYGITAGGTIITAQRVLNSELSQVP